MKSYDQHRQHIKKQRHYFASKGPYNQSYDFSVVMYGYESWIIKKAQHLRIDAFELLCWRRLLRVPWTGRRSNQSILREMNPKYSSEGLKLKLKLQYFCHLMWRANSLEKTLTLGMIEGKRRRGRQRMRWLDSITDSVDMNRSKLQKTVEDREVHGVAKSQTQLSDWTKTTDSGWKAGLWSQTTWFKSKVQLSLRAPSWESLGEGFLSLALLFLHTENGNSNRNNNDTQRWKVINNNNIYIEISCLPGTFPILLTVGVKYCYYPYFRDGETEAQFG